MFTSWIIEKNQPTNSSIELILKTPKKWNSKGWTAGQFISIQVNYGKSQIIRNYSVIEADNDRIKICIKIIEGGQFSSWLRVAQLNEKVKISEAMGDFILPKKLPQKMNFIAAGSGITPILSMVRSLRFKRITPDSIQVIYANRSPSEAIYLQELKNLCADLGINALLFFELDPLEKSQQGILTNKVCDQLVKASDHNTCWFVCGPIIIYNNLVRSFEHYNLDKSNLHTESFKTEPKKGFSGKFNFQDAVKTSVLDVSENETILDAIIRSGENVNFQCKAGICGSCILKLEDGLLINNRGGIIQSGERFLSCQCGLDKSGYASITNNTRKVKSRNFWIRVAAMIAALLVVGVNFSNNGELKMIGSYNIGHEDLKCEDCHRESDGNMRQQIQHNTKTFLGLHGSKKYVDIKYKAVTNEVCESCHNRPNDLHPISRFKEIRFSKERQTMGVHECKSCHGEHTGKRVAHIKNDFCKSCHSNTIVKNDPIPVTHKYLFENKKWNTCMQCHDFHGNHKYVIPQKMRDTFSKEKVNDYLNGKTQLYSKKKFYNSTK